MVLEKETINEIKKVTKRAGNCCSSTAKSKKISESKLNVPGFDPHLKMVKKSELRGRGGACL